MSYGTGGSCPKASGGAGQPGCCTKSSFLGCVGKSLLIVEKKEEMGAKNEQANGKNSKMRANKRHARTRGEIAAKSRQKTLCYNVFEILPRV
jgi:hypothetical protein